MRSVRKNPRATREQPLKVYDLGLALYGGSATSEIGLGKDFGNVHFRIGVCWLSSGLPGVATPQPCWTVEFREATRHAGYHHGSCDL